MLSAEHKTPVDGTLCELVGFFVLSVSYVEAPVTLIANKSAGGQLYCIKWESIVFSTIATPL